MPINNDQRTDFLWKKIIFGVTETDITGKQGPNESIASPLQVFGSEIYAESADIPRPAPAASTPIVRVFEGANAIQMVSDPTVAGDKTWIAVFDANGDPFDISNRVIDWLPPSLDPSYLLRVYNGDPNSGGVLVNGLTPNQEWVFDYIAGVLHFPNNLSSLVSGEIWIEGYQYIGVKGLNDGSSLTSDGMFEWITNPILPGDNEDRDFETGDVSFITDLTVDKPCLIEAHSTSDRNDTNPFRFRAIPGHLFDDGSYIQSGMRVYGPRYVILVGKDDPPNLTYWRVINEGSTTESFTINFSTKAL